MEGMWRTLYYEGCLPSNWLGKEIKPAHCSIINDSLLRKEKKQVDTLHDFTTGLQLMIILFNDWSADFLIINWFIILKNDLNDWSIKIVSRLIFFQLINPHQLTACFFFFFYEQQSMQRYSIYNHIKWRTAALLTFEKMELANVCHFLLIYPSIKCQFYSALYANRRECKSASMGLVVWLSRRT